MSAYLRMERIDPTEDVGFYIPGAHELDEPHKIEAIRARERRQRLYVVPPPYPAESDEIDGN